MTTATTSPLSDVSRKVLQLQVITLIWMSVEPIVSLGTAWTSHSPALLAFGGDSLIELLSAAVVFWRFRFALGEARAARIAGGLLFALAAFVVLTSVLNFFGYRERHLSTNTYPRCIAHHACGAENKAVTDRTLAHGSRTHLYRVRSSR
jgi:divalent metal cation (Fe/Co/Zn/Cd) transporter